MAANKKSKMSKTQHSGKGRSEKALRNKLEKLLDEYRANGHIPSEALHSRKIYWGRDE